MNCSIGLKITPEAKSLAELYEKRLADGTLPEISDNAVQSNNGKTQKLKKVSDQPVEVDIKEETKAKVVAPTKKKVAKSENVEQKEEEKSVQATKKKKRSKSKKEKPAPEKTSPETSVIGSSTEISSVEKEHLPLQEDTILVQAMEDEQFPSTNADDRVVEDPEPTIEDTKLHEQYYNVPEVKDEEGNFIWWISEDQRKEILNCTKSKDQKKKFFDIRRHITKLQHFPKGGYIVWESMIFPCNEKPAGCNGIVVSTELKEELQKIGVPGIFTRA